MSLIVTEYTTLEDYLNSLRSPILQRSAPNFDTLDTPPPLVDIPETPITCDTDSPPRIQEQSAAIGYSPLQQRTSAIDSDIDEPHCSYPPGNRSRSSVYRSGDESCHPERSVSNSMYGLTSFTNGPAVSEDLVQQALAASRKATEKLNDALIARSSTLAMHAQSYSSCETVIGPQDVYGRREKRQASISVSSLVNEEARDSLSVSHLSIQSSSPTDLDSRHSRPILPALHIGEPSQLPSRKRHDSTTSTPTLSSLTNNRRDGRSFVNMPRLNSHHSQSSTSTRHSPEFRQTLPPLEVALNSSSIHTTLPEMSSTLSRSSSTQQQHQALSPGVWSYSTPIQAPSPQRLPRIPSTWRMDSHGSNDSNNSVISDQLSGISSASLSTPATGPSPPPSYGQQSISDVDSLDSESLVEGIDHIGQADGVTNAHGYQCSWPGCNSPLFQTQYLLNSHQNVHSNQRPHFCPVEGCPRGPGGQGFKRKNEMIR